MNLEHKTTQEFIERNLIGECTWVVVDPYFAFIRYDDGSAYCYKDNGIDKVTFSLGQSQIQALVGIK